MATFSALTLVVLSIGILLVGYFSLRQFLLCLRFGLASRYWPVVEGQIVHSALEETPLPEFRDERKQPVEYEYVVDSKHYHSDRISYNHSVLFTSLSQKMEQRIKSYAVGTKVTIYYDPKQPLNATLVTGVGLKEAASNLLTGTAGVVGGAMLLFLGATQIS